MFRFAEVIHRGVPLGLVAAMATFVVIGPQIGQAQDQSSSQASVKLTQFVQDRGGAARINFAGKLRMLSQRIPAAACMLAAGVQVETSATVLKNASDEYVKILAGLEMGDENLGILGAEDRKKTLVGIRAVAEKYAPMQAAVTDLLAGGDAQAALATLYEANTGLLELAQKLVTEMVGEYSDPNAMTQAGALAVDIAGRQRMLSQKMVKLACKISTGAGVPEDAAELAKTIGIYDTTLTALINGMPEAGLQPAPTEEIKALLETIQSDWKSVQPSLDAAATSTPLAVSDLEVLLLTVEKMLSAMNETVALYAKAAAFEI